MDILTKMHFEYSRFICAVLSMVCSRWGVVSPRWTVDFIVDHLGFWRRKDWTILSLSVSDSWSHRFNSQWPLLFHCVRRLLGVGAHAHSGFFVYLFDLILESSIALEDGRFRFRLGSQVFTVALFYNCLFIPFVDILGSFAQNMCGLLILALEQESCGLPLLRRFLVTGGRSNAAGTRHVQFNDCDL